MTDHAPSVVAPGPLRAALLAEMRRMDCQDLFDDAFYALTRYEAALRAESVAAPTLREALENATSDLRQGYVGADSLLTDVRIESGPNGRAQWSRTRKVRDDLKEALHRAEAALRAESVAVAPPDDESEPLRVRAEFLADIASRVGTHPRRFLESVDLQHDLSVAIADVRAALHAPPALDAARLREQIDALPMYPLALGGGYNGPLGVPVDDLLALLDAPASGEPAAPREEQP